MSSEKSVTLVVDAATEIAKGRPKQWGVAVVGRTAQQGRRSLELDSARPLAAALDQLSAAKTTEFSTPTTIDWLTEYRAAIRPKQHVLSLHPPVLLDPSVAQARMARNLLRDSVYLVELPQVGLGLSKLVELLALLADKGWRIEELLAFTNRLQALMRCYFIAPLSFRSSQYIDRSMRGSLLGRSYAVLQIDPASGLYHGMMQGTAEKCAAYIVDEVGILMQQNRVRVSAEIRPIAAADLATPLINALQSSNIVHKQQTQWSPLVRNHLGKQSLEVCFAPTAKALLARGHEEQHLLAIAQRFEPRFRALNGQPRLRLSDY